MNSLLKLFSFIFIMTLGNMKAQQKIDLPDFGLSFIIPQGWNGEEQDGYIALGHQSIPGLMILSENTSENAKSLKELAMQGLKDSGINLQPKAEFSMISDTRVEGIYEGNFNGSQVTAYAIGLINGFGKGMNILIITESSVFSEQHQNEAKELANSVKFYKAKDSESTLQWKNKLVGRQLKYLSSDSSSDYNGGYSNVSKTRIINLCPDGNFTYYYNSNSSFAAETQIDGVETGVEAVSGMAEASNGNTGSYRIYTAGDTSYLELNFADKTDMEFELGTDSENFTTLNGMRYFNLNPEGCH